MVGWGEVHAVWSPWLTIKNFNFNGLESLQTTQLKNYIFYFVLQYYHYSFIVIIIKNKEKGENGR